MKAKQLVLVLGLMAACGAPQEDAPDALSSIPAIQGEVPLLGMGFSSLDANVTGNNCFTRLPIHYQKARDASLDFYRNLDYENLSHLIDAKVEIGVPVFPGISVKGRVRFADEFAASDYSETMTMRFKAIGESSRIYFGEDNIPEPVAATSLARLADNNDMNSIRRLCGDQYVASLDKGMELIATLKMEFTDSYARNAYGGGFGAEILGGIASVNLDVNYEKIMRDAGIKVNLAVQQRGGDPLQLLSILPSADDLKTAQVSEESTISFLNCSYESRQLCYEIFRRITQLAQGLSEQVKSDESDSVLGNMVPISFDVRDYPTSNSMRLAALGTEEASTLAARRAKLEDARRRLLLVDHEATEFRRRAENLMTALEGRGALNTNTSPDTVLQSDVQVMTKLRAIQTKANEALRLIGNIQRDCYNYDAIRSELGLDVCLSGNNLSGELAHKGAFGLWERFYKGDLAIREVDLNLDPQSFTEWCVLGYFPVLGNLMTSASAGTDPAKRPDEIPEIISASDFSTVKILVETSGTIPTNFTTLRDVCKNNENVLKRKIQGAQGLLNLDNRLIDSVKPLASLSDITQLSLVNNKIEDVTALRDLPKLRQLNLRRNKIRSLSMLRGFVSDQLESLNISRNVIGSGQLEGVLGQSDFRWPTIDLNGNVIEKIETLPPSPSLKKLDLRGNPLSDLNGLSSLIPAPGFVLSLCQDKAPNCPLSSSSGTCQIAASTDSFCLRAD